MVNDTILDVVSLLYYQSFKGKDAYVTELCRKTIDGVKVPEVVMEKDVGREITVSLKEIAEWAINKDKIDRNVLLQKLSVSFGNQMQSTFEYTQKTLIENPSKEQIEDSIKNYKTSISSSVLEKDFRKFLSESFNQTLFNKGKLKVSEVAMAISEGLGRFMGTSSGGSFEGITGLMGCLSMDNPESVNAVYQDAIDESSDEGILKCGWKGINRMLGWHDGFRRGDFWMIAAMQHQWKTGFSLNLTRHLATVNKPVVTEENKNKKPLILHISAENALTDNALLLYQGFKENETGEPVDIRGLNPEVATSYVIEKTKINGFHFEMRRINPSDFTYMSLFQLVEEYESQGFEIYAMTFDYLNMISKVGCMQGAQGMESRDLFRRVRNYMTEKKILFITPHQIASDAKNLLRMGVDDLVKELKGKSYWDSCRTLDQECDGILICHIEFDNGIPYYTVQLEKHRMAGSKTEEEHRYAAWRMHQAGAMRDDYHLDECTALKKVGADLRDTEDAWY